MTYIRNPREPLMWESDGDFNGKWMAIDGTLHDSAQEALKHDDPIEKALKRAPAQTGASGEPRR